MSTIDEWPRLNSDIVERFDRKVNMCLKKTENYGSRVCKLSGLEQIERA